MRENPRIARATLAEMYPTVGACLGLQDPRTPCKSLPALPGVSHTLGLKTPGRCSGAWAEQGREAQGLQDPPVPAGETRNATLRAFPNTQLRLLTQNSCSQAQPCTSGLECHLLPTAPLSSPCEGTTAAQSNKLPALTSAFNSSQTPDPKSNAISQAAGVPRVAGIAADANKVFFFFAFHAVSRWSQPLPPETTS